MEGNGIMKRGNDEIMKGNFTNGFLNGIGFIKYLGSKIEYFGEV